MAEASREAQTGMMSFTPARERPQTNQAPPRCVATHSNAQSNGSITLSGLYPHPDSDLQQQQQQRYVPSANADGVPSANRRPRKSSSLGSSVSDRCTMAEPRLLSSDMGNSHASWQPEGVGTPQSARRLPEQSPSSARQMDSEKKGDQHQAALSQPQEEQEDALPDDIEGDEVSTTVMAICYHGDRMGVAAYREVENAIDIQETHAFQSDMTDTLEGIKLSVRPRMILTDLRMMQNDALFGILVAPLMEGGDAIECKPLKRMCWDYQASVRGICANLQVQSLHRSVRQGAASSRSRWGDGAEDDLSGNNPGCDSFSRLGSLIDFQAQQQVRALGALLTHLQTTVFTLEASGTVAVTDVRQLDASGTMRIDAMAMRSLGIVAEEFHPNVLSGKGRSKEGFSVFALFDRTRSASGRRCLKEWMLKPLHHLGAITSRQDGVEALMQQENTEICRRLRLQLGKTNDMARTLLRVKKVEATFMDWCKLVQSLESTLDIREVLAVLKTRAAAAATASADNLSSGVSRRPVFLEHLLGDIDTVVLRCCLEGLLDVIDVPASMDDKTIVIRINFDEELDRKRRLLGDLPDVLREVGKVVLDENPVLDELSVEYVPQVGFLTALADRYDDLVPPDFSFAFAQADVKFYKNRRMYEMDDSIGDIQAEITDHQARIMRALEEAILEREAALHMAAVATAELDAALSLACVAGHFGFVRPEVVEENVIVIKNGRHPLQELTVDRFIPNDTYIADGSRVALITGANGSGKSVYLKQVGVIVFLAHVGSFVPAERALIGLTDRIYTRIATVETSAVAQSSFTIDVNQVARLIRSGSERSLLLIDEFGKGTAPVDGIALVAALIRHLSRTRRKCLLSLHFHEVFSQGLVQVQGHDDMGTDLTDVSVFRMEVLVPTPEYPRQQSLAGEDGPARGEAKLVASTSVVNADDGDGAFLPPTPLFKLVPGIASTSHGIACAEVAGLPQDVIGRARDVLLFEERGEPIQPQHRGRAKARKLSLACPQVRDVLRLFLAPPGDPSWQHAPDGAIDELLAIIRRLCGLAVEGA